LSPPYVRLSAALAAHSLTSEPTISPLWPSAALSIAFRSIPPVLTM
jgi:hypothetical protein